jgi:hypothetical protein
LVKSAPSPYFVRGVHKYRQDYLVNIIENSPHEP